MYRCNHCNTEFERPKLTHDGGYWEEEWYECPCCGSTDYDEISSYEDDE